MNIHPSHRVLSETENVKSNIKNINNYTVTRSLCIKCLGIHFDFHGIPNLPIKEVFGKECKPSKDSKY